MRTLLFLTFVTGCATTQSERWILPNGEKIICQQYQQNACGLNLKECGEAGSLEIDCLSEANYRGPGDYWEPEIFDEGKGAPK